MKEGYRLIQKDIPYDRRKETKDGGGMMAIYRRPWDPQAQWSACWQ